MRQEMKNVHIFNNYNTLVTVFSVKHRQRSLSSPFAERKAEGFVNFMEEINNARNELAQVKLTSPPPGLGTARP